MFTVDIEITRSIGLVCSCLSGLLLIRTHANAYEVEYVQHNSTHDNEIFKTKYVELENIKLQGYQIVKVCWVLNV
jgi:hypothetical protein